MKVLIVGGGGREHALAWAMKKSPAVDGVFIAPGNPGTARVGTNLPGVRTNDCDAMIRAARDHAIDLTVVGPESPLAQGMADRFREAGLRVFGPSAAAARLEGSKVFSKEFMARHGIPTAPFLVFDNAAAAHRHVDRTAPPIVLKADGLASGKGVTVAGSREEAHQAVARVMEKRIFGAAGDRVIIEEYMAGEEASLFVVSDGVRHLPFLAAQDHKRALDQDRGPNTGGMGAYAPAAIITRPLLAEINERIVSPALQGMASEGAPYTGLLYVGLMVSPLGPRVVEFNCRFGAPAAAGNRSLRGARFGGRGPAVVDAAGLEVGQFGDGGDGLARLPRRVPGRPRNRGDRGGRGGGGAGLPRRHHAARGAPGDQRWPGAERHRRGDDPGRGDRAGLRRGGPDPLQGSALSPRHRLSRARKRRALSGPLT
jgi:hypothetical protein